MLSAGRRLTFFATIACVLVAAISQSSPVDPVVAVADVVPSTIAPPPPPRDLEDDAGGQDVAGEDVAAEDDAAEDDEAEDSSALTTGSAVDELIDYMAKDMGTSIEPAVDRGHKKKPVMHKKKKPMGKHKKKKQTFKDKLLPLLLIPFVIQTMLIPMFIMNLKMFAMKAMVIGKIAILLIAFNMIRSWSQNSHSTSVRGTMNGLMAQNYGFNGGPEIGALFNGR